MPTISDVMTRLASGNQRYVQDETRATGRDAVRRSQLTGGQSPWAIILSCADSRVAPEIVFDTGLGELFVVRVAGNVANTSSIASIEYAVAHLGTPVIVVLGHQSCGAVTAAIQGGDNGYNLNHLLSHIAPATAQAPGAPVDEVVRVNARANAQALLERSAILRTAVEEGRLKIVPAYYQLTDGAVIFLD